MLRKTRIGAALMVAVLIMGAMPVFPAAAEAALEQPPVLTVSKPVAQTEYQNTTTVRLDFTDIKVGDAAKPKSITALYNADKGLESVAMGDIENGKASYAFNIPSNVTDYTVRSFVWNMDDLNPITEVLDLTKSEFDAMIPAATWDFEGTDTADISSMKTLHKTDENGNRVALYLKEGQWGIGFINQNDAELYEIPAQSSVSGIEMMDVYANSGLAYWGVDQSSPDSEKCISVSSSGPFRLNGMKVYLTNEQIVPGRKYSMTFYVKNNGHTKNGDYNNGVARDISAALIPRGSKLDWGNETNGGNAAKIPTDLPAYRDAYRTTQPGVKWIGYGSVPGVVSDREAVTTGTWQKQEIILTPDTGDFDTNGVTGLYLVFAPNDPAYTGGSLKKGETFYVDDVRITEIKETPAMAWDFADDSDISTGSELNKWTYATGSRNDKIYLPKVANDADLGNYMQLSTNGDTNWPRYLGTKVKLSKEQLEVDKTYKLTAKVKGFGDAGIYAHLGLTPYGDKTLKTCYNARKSGDNLPFAWLTYGKHDFYISHTTSGTVTYEFTPTADDFDDNGYANLWIMLTPNAEIYGEGEYSTINCANTFGFADIKIEPVLTEE